MEGNRAIAKKFFGMGLSTNNSYIVRFNNGNFPKLSKNDKSLLKIMTGNEAHAIMV